jgi:prepilin-type N-terminal cleavage/methylation domain-containing protein
MTLVELMIVVAIVGVMSVAAMFGLSGGTNAQNAANLARSIEFAVQRARSESVSDNKQRALTCDAPTASAPRCTYKIANATGMATVDFTDATKYAADGIISYGRYAKVHNITRSTDYNANKAGTAMSSATTIVFYPDGTADKATFYVGDTNSGKTGNQYKIYVYQGTALARLVSNW